MGMFCFYRSAWIRRPAASSSAALVVLRKGASQAVTVRGEEIVVTGLPRPGKMSVGPGAVLMAGFYFDHSAVRLRDGTWMATLYGTFEGANRYSVVAVRSADGTKWKFHSVIADETCKLPGEEGSCEADVCRLKDGRLTCVFRLASGPRYGQTWSTDEGKTWTEPIAMPAHSVWPSLAVMDDGTVALSEPYDLVCLDKNSGKILWARSVNYFEATPEADRKGNPLFDEAAKLAAELNRINDAYGTPAGPSKEQLAAKAEAQKKLYETMVKIDPAKYTLTRQQDFGMAGFVPMSDGKNVWAWFASGITACYDLDGNRRWITLDNRPGEQHHGYQTSPLLVGGKVILYMYDIEALDAKTGAVAWTRPICKDPKKEHWWSAIGGGFCALEIGGVPMFMTSNTDIYRTADGQQVFLDNPMAYYQLAAPVVDGSTVCNVKNDGRVYILKLPAEAAGRIRPLSSRKVKLDTSECRMFYQDSLYWGGPVLSDGLLYCMKHTGVLSVVDVEKAAVVYQKKLDVDLDAFMRPSLAKAGKYLYALGTTGTCAVFESGREFKLVAKNRLEPVLNAGTGNPRLERFTADPVLDGKRVYLRGESNLYCIEEK